MRPWLVRFETNRGTYMGACCACRNICAVGERYLFDCRHGHGLHLDFGDGQGRYCCLKSPGVRNISPGTVRVVPQDH